MYIVFIGPPGSGKGTQCERLVHWLGIPQLSTGQIMRDVISQGTALSRWLAKELQDGQLAPDHMAMRIVSERLQDADCANGCLLDGFPRTVVQARLFDEWLARHQAVELAVVLELRVDREVVVRRLQGRAESEGRQDDAPTIISQRLDVYRRLTEPLIDYYRRKGLLQRIDGMQPAEQVFKDIQQVIRRSTASGNPLDG